MGGSSSVFEAESMTEDVAVVSEMTASLSIKDLIA
jgi:hypothetical protein